MCLLCLFAAMKNKAKQSQSKPILCLIGMVIVVSDVFGDKLFDFFNM
jgi:hypothetical protein